jgi:xylulokinase
MAYLLGIDISTTSAKALVINETGKVIGVYGTPQSVNQPHPLWSEQNPAAWWGGVAASIRGVLSEAGLTGDDITGIGLTGQMHGLVMLGTGGEVLRPSILWNDQRTGAQCVAMTEKIGAARLIELTGNQALTGFTAPKILWVRDNEPEVYAHCAHILLPKDYIRLKLTGDYHTDMAGAAGTSLLNVRDRVWSAEVLDALDIPMDWMPKVHEGTEVTGVISAEAATVTGLKPGTPVVGGGGDQAAGAVGMGAVMPEVIGVTVGTSGVVFAPLADYAYESEGRLHAFCHAVPGHWHFMGVMLAAAGSLQWYRDTFAADTDFGDLVAEAGTVPAGSDGLYFTPYITGERTPHPDPHARGGFVGITSRHTRAHFTRAVLEGVAYGLKDAFTLIDNVGLPDSYEVRIAGGGARSNVWQQVIADVLGVPLVNTNTTEGGAFGAALLGGVGAGVFPNVAEACAATIKTGETVEPSDAQAVYTDLYPTYQQLYAALRPVYTA